MFLGQYMNYAQNYKEISLLYNKNASYIFAGYLFSKGQFTKITEKHSQLLPVVFTYADSFGFICQVLQYLSLPTVQYDGIEFMMSA